uniref:Protein FAM33A n=1 Tax=Taeniopygia guttata TaxID=59729 RepID=H0ZAU3_TAEGU
MAAALRRARAPRERGRRCPGPAALRRAAPPLGERVRCRQSAGEGWRSEPGEERPRRRCNRERSGEGERRRRPLRAAADRPAPLPASAARPAPANHSRSPLRANGLGRTSERVYIPRGPIASALREQPANGRRAAVTAGQWAPPTLPAAARGVGISAPPPEECQLFNMEPAVNNLQTLFQKAEADLDYIQSRLEFEIANSHPDDATAEENPAALLKEISLVKSRYKSLCDQMVQISREQKESMESIRAALQETMKLSRALQQQSGLESLPLSAEEQAAIHQLNLQFGEEMEFPVQEKSSSHH